MVCKTIIAFKDINNRKSKNQEAIIASHEKCYDRRRKSGLWKHRKKAKIIWRR